MDVSTSIDLPEAEQEELSKILGCNNAELAETLSRYTAAALSEYISAHEAKRVEQFEAHLVRRRRCPLGKSNREYPSHSRPHEPTFLCSWVRKYLGGALTSSNIDCFY
jgi:hypothetical protein